MPPLETVHGDDGCDRRKQVQGGESPRSQLHEWQDEDADDVGYNVQTAVDTERHLIIAHEMTNVGSDRHQLKRMSELAREALGSQELTALADRGYYSGEEIKACDDAGIVPLVPKVLTSNSKAEGRYDKSDFVYEPERDAFRCPAGEYAIRRSRGLAFGNDHPLFYRSWGYDNGWRRLSLLDNNLRLAFWFDCVERSFHLAFAWWRHRIEFGYIHLLTDVASAFLLLRRARQRHRFSEHGPMHAQQSSSLLLGSAGAGN